MAGSEKITLWGPQRTPLGILRVKDTGVTKPRLKTRSSLNEGVCFR